MRRDAVLVAGVHMAKVLEAVASHYPREAESGGFVDKRGLPPTLINDIRLALAHWNSVE